MKLAFALLAAAAVSSGDTAREVRFVTCPIYRDTDAGRKSGCWLANDNASGIRYDVTSSASKPDWNHAILVEGRVDATGGKPCGGVVMDPVRVSVLDQPCTRFMLEAEGFAGRKFALPKRNVRPLYEKREPPQQPWQPRTFALPFDFDSHFVVYQLTDYYLDAALNYAIDTNASQVTITGFAATSSTDVSGVTLEEPARLAQDRAELVARAFQMRGFARDRIIVNWQEKPEASDDEAFDGLVGPSYRRVDVAIVPGNAS